MAPRPDELDRTPPPLAELQPFHAELYGFAVGDDWANSLAVDVVSLYDPELDDAAAADPVRADDEATWVADHVERHLVQLDTNYKPTRPGPHPVRLTRPASVRLAATLLRAVGDTFESCRVGELRTAEAIELLRALSDVDEALLELRAHAVEDLARRLRLTGARSREETD